MININKIITGHNEKDKNDESSQSGKLKLYKLQSNSIS